jgi:uncharacterized protein
VGLIYLDSCICIYAIEQTSGFHQEARATLTSQPMSQFCVSHLVMAECLVKPLRFRDGIAIGRFEDFFKEATNLDLGEAVYRQAAQIRSASSLKMPDAIHLACAQFHGCDELWTNDERLNGVSRGLARRVVG